MPKEADRTSTAARTSARTFFEKRAGDATGKGLMKYLEKAPRRPPDPEDALPAPTPRQRRRR